jgi:hypothetical protein
MLPRRNHSSAAANPPRCCSPSGLPISWGERAIGAPLTCRDYVPLVNLISIYFQIRDDYMNLQSSEYADNKGYCEDLTEGKFSFPVVHGVRADFGNRQILSESSVHVSPQLRERTTPQGGWVSIPRSR